jgi:hypothetical protein
MMRAGSPGKDQIRIGTKFFETINLCVSQRFQVQKNAETTTVLKSKRGYKSCNPLKLLASPGGFEPLLPA